SGLDGIPVLEAESGIFGERAVVDGKRCLAVRQVMQRRIGLARLRVVQYDVSMAEGTALGVFTGQPDRDTVLEERAVGDDLGVAPVQLAVFLVQDLRSRTHLAPELAVRR